MMPLNLTFDRFYLEVHHWLIVGHKNPKILISYYIFLFCKLKVYVKIFKVIYKTETFLFNFKHDKTVIYAS